MSNTWTLYDPLRNDEKNILAKSPCFDRLCSVVGALPSWYMIANFRYGRKVSPPDKHYALADQFNPQDYDPGMWLKAAKDADL